MGQKVTFDPVTKIIQIDTAPVSGVVDLDVKIDLYSDGKEDWRANPELFKLRFPLRSVGGDGTPTGVLGSTFFLAPPWKIRPYEADHIFKVSGNFFAEDGTSPFTTTVGAYNVFLEQNLSNLVDTVSSGSGLDVAQDEKLTSVHQAHFNRRLWDKNGNTITVYDTDGVTPLHVFDTNSDMSEVTPQ